MAKTCFVIMPISDINLSGKTITKAQLRSRYDDLIKEALQRAAPGLEVVRADDVAAPGGVTTDIFTRLMHSDYVLADITFPNPNVFYELGIRHACRPGTILVREQCPERAPFDIAGLRHIEYENSPSGLKRLAAEIRQRFDWIDLHINEPDNDFLSLAKLTAYPFPSYDKKDENEQKAAVFNAIVEMSKHPDLMEMFIAHGKGTPIDQAELIRRLAEKPEAFRAILFALVRSGQLKF